MSGALVHFELGRDASILETFAELESLWCQEITFRDANESCWALGQELGGCEAR